ncbi:unnamed protein product, partial [Amoebophrya sp. A120]|eukprot:GSA120T00021007001.1
MQGTAGELLDRELCEGRVEDDMKILKNEAALEDNTKASSQTADLKQQARTAVRKNGENKAAENNRDNEQNELQPQKRKRKSAADEMKSQEGRVKDGDISAARRDRSGRRPGAKEGSTSSRPQERNYYTRDVESAGGSTETARRGTVGERNARTNKPRPSGERSSRESIMRPRDNAKDKQDQERHHSRTTTKPGERTRS